MPKAGCALDKLKASLSEEDTEALLKLLGSEFTARVVSTLISEELQVDIGAQTISKHRSDACRCRW